MLSHKSCKYSMVGWLHPLIIYWTAAEDLLLIHGSSAAGIFLYSVGPGPIYSDLLVCRGFACALLVGYTWHLSQNDIFFSLLKYMLITLCLSLCLILNTEISATSCRGILHSLALSAVHYEKSPWELKLSSELQTCGGNHGNTLY